VLTVGVPTKGTSLSLIRVLEYCVNLSSAFEIIISINPGNTDIEIPSKYLNLPNFRFVWQNDDLGLYGNFRFLLENANSQLFCWFCVDDNISGDIYEICNYAIHAEQDLTVATWQLDEYDMTTARFYGSPRFGDLPDLTNKYTKVCASLNIDPSWMFGVWKTSYLQNIFPKKDFDWLDCDILQEVLLNGKTSIFKSANPALIGTHYNLNRQPNAVNNRGHSPRIAISRQLVRLPQYIRFGPLVTKLLIIRCWTLYSYSTKLNQSRQGNFIRRTL
jgi:hypothetical protein